MGGKMLIDKNELLEMIDKDFSDNSMFELSIEIIPPDDSYNTLIGTEYGSAQHLIRRDSQTEKGCWVIKYTRTIR
jgi:hypothetical protein